MKKIFSTVLLLLIFMTATAFAEEEETSAGYDYTSATFGFKIVCPAEPKVVVNPFPDPKKRGELLIFAVTEDGQDIAYGYQIMFDAFDSNSAPDFNKGRKKLLESYLEKLKTANAYETAVIEKVSANNKGVFAVTAKEIEMLDDNGEVLDVAVASTQNAITFFRTKSGRCISIQLITTNLDDEAISNFRKSVSTYQDATDIAMGK